MTVFRDLGTVRLETERLILRRFTEEDAEAAFRGWTGDDACAARCSWRVHPTPGYTRDILAHWIDEYEDDAYNWAVELKETHELIGTISTVSITRKHRNCEIGYCYGSRYWGKGYATEALRRAIDFLLSECGFHLVEARHISSNSASGRVMQKAGMHLDAVLPDRHFDTETGHYYDTLVYSIKNEAT